MSVRSIDPFETSLSAIEEERDGGVDIRRFIGAFLRYKWAILVLVAATGAGAWLYANTLTSSYDRATSKLFLQPESANIVSIEGFFRPARRGQDLRTEIEIIRSRSVAELVVERLELHRNMAFLGSYQRGMLDPGRWVPSMAAPEVRELPEEAARSIAIGRVRGGLSAGLVPGTNLLNISFESPFRDVAVEVANAVGEAYIDSGLESRVQSSTRASTWLAERLDALRDSLRSSEQRLQEYRENEGLAEASAATGDASVVRVAAQDLDQARGRLAEQQAEVLRLESALQQLSNSPRDQWGGLNVLTRSEALGPLLTARIQSQRRIGELSQVYGVKHPKMVQAQAEFDEIEQVIDERVASVRAGMRAELENARAQVVAIGLEIESQRDRIQSMQRQQFELTKLQRDVEADQRLYDLFLERIKETEQAGFEEPVARVVEQARGAYGPVRPDKNRIVMMAIFSALAFAMGLVVLKEMLDNTFKSPDDLANSLGLPSLGLLPQVASGEGRGRVGLLSSTHEQGSFAEAVRTLRTSVVLSGLDKPHQVICVTSAMPGEGKTTVASNLALSMARLERVLLIDADMRRPSVAREFDLPASMGGVSAIIAGEKKAEQCISSHSSGLDVLPAGIVPPNPLELLSSKRFRALLDALRKRYDRIIIDTAPVHAVSDALVMASLVDAVVFVVKSDSTSRQIVQTSIRRLRQVHAPLVGTVLNRIVLTGKGGYHGYYGYYGYAEYTSEAAAEDSASSATRVA